MKIPLLHKINNRKKRLKENQRRKVEEEIYNSRMLHKRIQYSTRVKMSLIDMNVHTSIIKDVENGMYDGAIQTYEKYNMDPSECALFIISNFYYKNKYV